MFTEEEIKQIKAIYLKLFEAKTKEEVTLALESSFRNTTFKEFMLNDKFYTIKDYKGECMPILSKDLIECGKGEYSSFYTSLSKEDKELITKARTNAVLFFSKKLNTLVETAKKIRDNDRVYDLEELRKK